MATEATIKLYDQMPFENREIGNLSSRERQYLLEKHRYRGLLGNRRRRRDEETFTRLLTAGHKDEAYDMMDEHVRRARIQEVGDRTRQRIRERRAAKRESVYPQLRLVTEETVTDEMARAAARIHATGNNNVHNPWYQRAWDWCRKKPYVLIISGIVAGGIPGYIAGKYSASSGSIGQDDVTIRRVFATGTQAGLPDRIEFKLLGNYGFLEPATGTVFRARDSLAENYQEATGYRLDRGEREALESSVRESRRLTGQDITLSALNTDSYLIGRQN